MSHDPIHDWLDMVFSRAGGEKNAYRRYKRDQAQKRADAKWQREWRKYDDRIARGLSPGPRPRSRAHIAVKPPRDPSGPPHNFGSAWGGGPGGSYMSEASNPVGEQSRGQSEYAAGSMASMGPSQHRPSSNRYGNNGVSDITSEYSLTGPSSGRRSPGHGASQALLTVPGQTAYNSNTQGNTSALSHSYLSNETSRTSKNISNEASRRPRSPSSSNTFQSSQSQRLTSRIRGTAPNNNTSTMESSRPSHSRSNATSQRYTSRPNAHALGANVRSYSESQILLDPVHEDVLHANSRTKKERESVGLHSARNVRPVGRVNAKVPNPQFKDNNPPGTSNALVHRVRDPKETTKGHIPLIASHSKMNSGSASHTLKPDSALLGKRPDMYLHPNKANIGSLPGQKGAESHLQRARRVPRGSEVRAATSVAPLGDMTRSYLEGMSPNSEVSSFLRHQKS